ncbi:putative enoyl-CoA hydratase [Trichoderma austrokoningii]
MPYVPEPWSFDDTLKLTKISPAYWRATFNAPPLNLFKQRTYKALRTLVELLENDPAVKVVVFDSSAPDYFIAHYDFSAKQDQENAEVKKVEKDQDAVPEIEWPSFIPRFNRLSAVTIAEVRGRARGIGAEFLLACDIRYASLEKAVFGHPDVGFSLTCGGGAIEWLPKMVGRSQALEILLGSQDFDAATAAQYGYVNRAIKDSELSVFVDNFARRIAGFDKKPLAETKQAVNDRAGVLSQSDLRASLNTFGQLCVSPEALTRIGVLYGMGLQQDGPVERDMGQFVHEASLKLLEKKIDAQ